MLDTSITYIPESNHRVPGIGEIKIIYSHSKREVNIYYGSLLLESYGGEKAKEIKIELESNPKINHLKISEINRIASVVCHIDVRNITMKTKEMEYVVARWLCFDYLKHFSYSNMKVAKIYSVDGSTVRNGIVELNNEKLAGWILDNRIKFRAEIDRIHRNAGIKVINW